MASLIYLAITSLDGYVADEEGNFDWAAPGEEVHAFVNGLERTAAQLSSGIISPQPESVEDRSWTRWKAREPIRGISLG